MVTALMIEEARFWQAYGDTVLVLTHHRGLAELDVDLYESFTSSAVGVVVAGLRNPYAAPDDGVSEEEEAVALSSSALTRMRCVLLQEDALKPGALMHTRRQLGEAFCDLGRAVCAQSIREPVVPFALLARMRAVCGLRDFSATELRIGR